MSGELRTTISGKGSKFPSRTPGDITAVQMNTFGLQKLIEGVNGEALSIIALEAWQPALEIAREDWPKDTHASVESMELVIIEIGDKHCRVALQVGGEKLRQDERNKSGEDYAPYIEFNGTSTTSPGTITHAVHSTEAEAKAKLREGVAVLIRELIGG